MTVKKTSDKNKKTQIKLHPRQKKGASLAEAGMLLGLVAVSAIGAVMTTGEEVETAFCVAANGVADGMEHERPLEDCDVNGESPGGGFTGGTTTPPPPTQPQPPGWTDGNFNDMHYNLNTSGVRHVMMPFETTESSLSFRASVVSHNSYSDGKISACYITPEAGRVCNDRSGGNTIALPDNATHIGYEITLPDEAWKPWTNEVILKVKNSASDPEWSVTVDREQGAPAFNPTFSFSDNIYPKGTTGQQTVLVEKTGDFEGPLRFDLITDGGTSGVGPCIQETSESQPTCYKPSYTNLSLNADTYAIGYQMTLPGDTYVNYNKVMKAQLTSPIWEDHYFESDFVISRTPEAAAVRPSFTIADKEFPQGTSGSQIVMYPMDGNFSGGMTMSYKLTERSAKSFGLCVQQTETDAPVCNLRTNATGTVGVPDDVYAIGYVVNFGATLYNTQSATSKITLQSNYVAEEVAEWDFVVSRQKKPVQVDPTFSMTGKEFPEGTTGTKVVMFPMEGNFAGDMTMSYRLSKNDSSGFGLCVQATSTSTPSCNIRSYATGTMGVPEDAYAIGYAVKMRSDTFRETDVDAAIQLRSYWDSDEKVDWLISATRPAIPVVFEPTFSFSKTNYAKGTTGVKYIKRELTGNFNTDMTLSSSKRNGISGAGYAKMCKWETATSAPTCGDYYVNVTPDTHSIGIKITLSTNTTKHVQGSVPMQFYPKKDISQKISFPIEAERLPQ